MIARLLIFVSHAVKIFGNWEIKRFCSCFKDATIRLDQLIQSVLIPIWFQVSSYSRNSKCSIYQPIFGNLNANSIIPINIPLSWTRDHPFPLYPYDRAGNERAHSRPGGARIWIWQPLWRVTRSAPRPHPDAIPRARQLVRGGQTYQTVLPGTGVCLLPGPRVKGVFAVWGFLFYDIFAQGSHLPSLMLAVPYERNRKRNRCRCLLGRRTVEWWD